MSRPGEIPDRRLRRQAADAGTDLRRRAGTRAPHPERGARVPGAPRGEPRQPGTAARRRPRHLRRDDRRGRIVRDRGAARPDRPALDQPVPLPRLRDRRAARRGGDGGGRRGADRVAGLRPLGRAPAGDRPAGRPAGEEDPAAHPGRGIGGRERRSDAAVVRRGGAGRRARGVVRGRGHAGGARARALRPRAADAATRRRRWR